MNNLLPPKYMRWNYALDQQYYCNQKQLITSGCSFTASTNQLDCAASWPGFMRDRCRFEETIDLSYPGMGNDYIYQSIMNNINNESLVVVMWSGIDNVDAEKWHNLYLLWQEKLPDTVKSMINA
jgi:hypothetical protein